MSGQAEEDFARDVGHRMLEAGLAGAKLVSPGPAPGAFGDAIATFRLDALLMRAVRDRGEEFLDIGCTEDPGVFFQYDDVEIAMGWQSIEEVLARQTPEPLGAVLERVARRLRELQTAFSPGHYEATRSRVRQAEKKRGEAFVARLREQQALAARRALEPGENG